MTKYSGEEVSKAFIRLLKSNWDIAYSDGVIRLIQRDGTTFRRIPFEGLYADALVKGLEALGLLPMSSRFDYLDS